MAPRVHAAHGALGEMIRQLLREGSQAYLGDRLVTDAWAKELGFRDWFEWRRLDEVR